MTTALFIGRFQPFHNAHLKVINEIAKSHRLIIAIGSTNESRTRENPFTEQERKKMIELAVGKKHRVIGIPDVENDEDWPDHVASYCDFDVVYSGNKLVIKLMKNHGYKVKKVKLIPGISATEIRQRIRKNKEWKHLVPEKVYEYLNKIDVHRIIS